MADSYRAPGGWRVQVVTLEGTPDRRDGTWIRVTQYGVWTADVRTVAELEQFFPLGELEPDGPPLALGRLGRSGTGLAPPVVVDGLTPLPYPKTQNCASYQQDMHKRSKERRHESFSPLRR